MGIRAPGKKKEQEVPTRSPIYGHNYKVMCGQRERLKKDKTKTKQYLA